MRLLILIAVLVSAAAGYSHPSYAGESSSAKDASAVTVVKDEGSTLMTLGAEPSSSSPSSSSSLSTQAYSPTTAPAITSTAPAPAPIKEETNAPLLETASEAPTSLAPTIGELENESSSKRRIITYDQRQEGQYNIRADLDNFMIVLIPPSPADGLGLLELLSKTAFRRNSHPTKAKRKHYSSSAVQQANSAKYRHSLRNGDNSQNFNYLLRNPDAASNRNFYSSYQNSQGQQPSGTGEQSSFSHRLPEFIEGRTPYHVDISASDDEQARLHPEHQVDVLPPPYPLAYQHLIKPFHLEAEPTVIQALPPADLKPAHASGDFLQLLTAGSLNANAGLEGGGSYYTRGSRAIREDNFLDSNRVTSSNSLSASPQLRRVNLPIYRSDLTFGASSLYPPIDVPRFPAYLTLNPHSRTLQLHGDEADDREQKLDEAHVGEVIVPPNLPAEDDLELDLRSISFIDAQAKELLSDGMERCAPGKRRDSYGVCREIEGY